MIMRIRIALCFLVPIVSCAGEASMSETDDSSQFFVTSRFVRVGVDLRLGGAVTCVSEPGGPNLINSYDLGRQIQQSYYSGPANYQKEGKQKSPAWNSFPWNPIQTGDAYANGSMVLAHRVRDGELYIKTVPMLWPMNNDPAECLMETWIRPSLDAPAFAYRARLTNARSDKTQYGAYHQEVPAIYVNGPWHRLMTYTGDKPFTGGAVSEVRNDHKEEWPWVNFLPTEGWAALVKEDGTGIGVCVSTPMEFHGGFAGQRGRGGEKSGNTGYMAPITKEILDHNIVYEYACTFFVGSIEDIRTEAMRLAPKLLPSWNLDHSRHGWYYENGRDAGWPIAGRGLSMKADNPAQPVRLIGPYTFWRAESSALLRMRLSSTADDTMRVHWRGVPPPKASARPSEWRAWRQTWFDNARSVEAKITAGDRKWVTIRLAGLPGYQGGMTGFAMDLPNGVTVHDVCLGNEGASAP